MKIFALLCLFRICFFIEPCKAQECESVEKSKAKDGFSYIGICAVDIPDNTNTSQNQVGMLILAKDITKSDTTYSLNVVVNAVAVSEKSPSSGILLQFESGFKLAKANQPIEISLMPGDQAVLSAAVELTLGEMQKMKDRTLISITLGSSKTGLVESLSKSVKEVANCLSMTW